MQEFEPPAETQGLQDLVSFLVSKGLDAAADLQTLWPLYHLEGSAGETQGYRRKLTVLESLAASVPHSLQKADALAQDYEKRYSCAWYSWPGAGRSALLNLLFRLRLDLEGEADEHRRRRDPDDPSLFWYEMTIIEEGRARFFRFAVDDGRAPGYRFLEAMQEAD